MLLVFRLNDDNARHNRARAVEQARAGALAAATAEAQSLTTISYRSAVQDLARILEGSTGKLRQQFAAEQGQFPTLLARQKSDSVGNVISAGVVSCSAAKGTAQVVIAADATVKTSASPQPVVKHYRMVMKLVRTSGRWLVSDLAFAGAPQ